MAQLCCNLWWFMREKSEYLMQCRENELKCVSFLLLFIYKCKPKTQTKKEFQNSFTLPPKTLDK